ncbi:hypothetical protein VTL71DRAFT_4201 [Oculimacula yallundae]|uniref:Uncharacterized protein n=1 Tax=Oculimacula yallundae TaxID=86028 RepID=A0ABR4C6B7_9HELO
MLSGLEKFSEKLLGLEYFLDSSACRGKELGGWKKESDGSPKYFEVTDALPRYKIFNMIPVVLENGPEEEAIAAQRAREGRSDRP